MPIRQRFRAASDGLNHSDAQAHVGDGRRQKSTVAREGLETLNAPACMPALNICSKSVEFCDEPGAHARAACPIET